MLLLNMGYAISIHNSQGKNIDNLIVNIGSNELTRVRKFENLYFEPFFNFDRFDKEIRKQKMFIERRKKNLMINFMIN
jgi:ATP-dependent exoDNAse (exonuclease V) alpha subunit